MPIQYKKAKVGRDSTYTGQKGEGAEGQCLYRTERWEWGGTVPIQDRKYACDTWLGAELPGSQSKTIDLLHISVMSSSRGLVLNWSKTWTHHFLLKTKITYQTRNS